MSCAFKSFIFSCAIFSACFIVIEPTTILPGSFDPPFNFAASFIKCDAGGDFINIALKENANDSFVYGEDEIDHPNTIQPEFIDMHIDRFDWVGTSDNRGIMVESPYFSSDVRSFSGAEEFLAWNISADTYNTPGDVKLSWNMTDDIESDVHLIVKGEAYNLKELVSIDVPNTSLDKMVLVVGDINSFFS